MREFTVKDFITYNNPCFSCGSTIHINVMSTSQHSPHASGVVLKSNVKPDRTEIQPKITYRRALQLWIFNQSNKIITSDIRGLTEYLYEHKLYLRSYCKTCNTEIFSHFLEFDIAKNLVKPFGISSESLRVQDSKTEYCIYSSLMEEKSQISIHSKFCTSIRVDSPLLLLNKLKTREVFLNKMKIYLLFS